MVNTMEFPWNFGIWPCFCYIYPCVFHVFPMVKHGISFGVLSMAIEKAWEFHEKPMDFHGQYDKFSKYGHGFPWILVTMDSQ